MSVGMILSYVSTVHAHVHVHVHVHAASLASSPHPRSTPRGPRGPSPRRKRARGARLAAPTSVLRASGATACGFCEWTLKFSSLLRRLHEQWASRISWVAAIPITRPAASRDTASTCAADEGARAVRMRLGTRRSDTVSRGVAPPSYG